MYCQKCGTQNNDDSKFCCNCAAPLSHSSVADNSTKPSKSKLFSANILNIISAVVLILSFVLLVYCASHAVGSMDSVTTNGSATSSTNATITLDTSGAPIAYIACAIDAIVVILGFVIYFSKNHTVQKKLSVLYMIGACIMTCVLAFGGFEAISFTCGMGFVMIVAGILQIIAGAKFISATKHA